MSGPEVIQWVYSINIWKILSLEVKIKLRTTENSDIGQHFKNLDIFLYFIIDKYGKTAV